MTKLTYETTDKNSFGQLLNTFGNCRKSVRICRGRYYMKVWRNNNGSQL